METVKILLKILSKKEKKEVSIIILITILNSISELIGIGSLIPFFLAILDPSNPLLEKIYGYFNIDNRTLIIFGLVGVITVYSSKLLIQTLYIYLTSHFTAKVNTRLSHNIYKKYLNDDYEEIAIINDKGNIFRNLGLVGDVTNNIFNLINFFQAMILTLVLSATMIIVDFKISISLVLTMLSVVTIYYILIKPKITNYGSKYYQINKDTIMRIFSAFDSIKTTKIVGNHDFFLNKFHETQIDLNFMNRNKNFLQSLPKVFLEYLFVLGIVISCGYIFYFQNSNKLGAIIFISMGLVRILPQIFTMLHLAINYDFLKKSFLSVFDKKFYEGAKILKNKVENKIMFKGDIELKGVKYSYPNSKGELFKDFNLKINFGKILGIRGTSGRGKTTLVDIILGFLKPQEGSILIDSIEIESLYKKFKNISYVVQEIFIAQASIRENIAFGQDKIDNDRVLESIKLAKFENKFYDKEINGDLNFKLKQMGVNLSAGERQRLNIARAFYFRPKLLILDELTSSLDRVNSESILESVKNYAKNYGCTVILISHNLEDYKICDEVLDIENL